MTDSTLTPSQEAREAAWKLAESLGVPDITGPCNQEETAEQFARFEQAIRRDEAEKCAALAASCNEGVEPPSRMSIGWKSGFNTGVAVSSVAIAAVIRARHADAEIGG